MMQQHDSTATTSHSPTPAPQPAAPTATAAVAAPADTAAAAAPDSAAAPLSFTEQWLRAIDSPRAHFTESDAPTAVTEQKAVRGEVDYLAGMQPLERPTLPGYDSGVVCLILGVFLFASANIRHYSAYLKSMLHDLWQVRRRSNAFDDPTVSEMRVSLSLVIMLCLSEGILLYSSPLGPADRDLPFVHIVAFTVVAAVLYVFQLTAYQVVGTVFGGRIETSQWVKGFTASQSLLSLALVLPALVVLFDPGLASAMCLAGFLLFLLARMMFIFKGFRIFYTIPTSLVYFILYLCTLEIVPLSLIYRMSTIINVLEPYK